MTVLVSLISSEESMELPSKEDRLSIERTVSEIYASEGITVARAGSLNVKNLR